MLKIIFQVSEHKIDSIEKLEEELGSHYGVSLSKIYPKDEEFSIPRMIEVLSDLPDDIFTIAGKQKNPSEPQVFKDIKIEYEKKAIEDAKRTFSDMYSRGDYEYSNDEYCIIVPKIKEDVELEGKNLKHCVGSYIGTIITGNSKTL